MHDPAPRRVGRPAAIVPAANADPMVIHALAVGGGILGIASLPGGGGDHAGDRDHIRAWTPAIVLCLVTEDELVEAGAETLGASVQDMGTRWVHLPVPDRGTPDRRSEALWPDISARIRRALKGGGRVLVHCAAGCGRSGMAALRLMVECGEPADAALARLRAIRPCAVETEAQHAWACDAAPSD